MIARFCVLVCLALGLGSAGAEVSSTASEPPQQWRTIPDEAEPNAPPSECDGSLHSGPSLDDPNVDTDPDRPITELTSDVEDDFDGACRSETLELWFQPDGEDAMVLTKIETARAHG